MLDSKAAATVDQSISMPDYFSCRNCIAWQYHSKCQKLQDAGLCAKQILSRALDSGNVRIVLHLPERNRP